MPRPKPAAKMRIDCIFVGNGKQSSARSKFSTVLTAGCFPFLVCRRAGVSHGDVCMSVLIQPLVEAEYAFVAHTVNPSNGDASQVRTILFLPPLA